MICRLRIPVSIFLALGNPLRIAINVCSEAASAYFVCSPRGMFSFIPTQIPVSKCRIALLRVAKRPPTFAPSDAVLPTVSDLAQHCLTA